MVKLKNLPRKTLIIICPGLLIFQLSLLLRNYIAGNTLVNIRLTNEKSNLPGITICYDRLFNFEKLIEFSPEHQKNFWKYVNENDENSSKIYDHLTKNIIKHDEVFGYRDILVNLSIPYEYQVDNDTYHAIDVTVSGKLSSYENFHIKERESNRSIYLGHPIESMLYWKNSQRKCFTYFSWLNKQFRELTLQAFESKILLEIYFNRKWFPIDIATTKLYLALHSPNLMPEMKIFKEFNIGSSVKLFYSKVETHSLSGKFLLELYLTYLT